MLSRRKIVIFLVLMIAPFYTYFSFLTHGSFSLNSFLKDVIIVFSLPGLSVAFIVDNIVCRRWFNYNLNGISYYRCDFYESPLFTHIFLLGSIITACLLTILTDKILSIINRKRYF